MSKVRASVIGLTVAYVLPSNKSSICVLAHRPAESLSTRGLEDGCVSVSARVPVNQSLKGRRRYVSFYQGIRKRCERDVERIESGAPKAKRIR